MQIPQTTRTSGKSKSRSKKPARMRYWLTGQLEKHKVAHLMKYCGMTKEKAVEYWRSVRKGRMPTTVR